MEGVGFKQGHPVEILSGVGRTPVGPAGQEDGRIISKGGGSLPLTNVFRVVGKAWRGVESKELLSKSGPNAMLGRWVWEGHPVEVCITLGPGGGKRACCGVAQLVAWQ